MRANVHTLLAFRHYAADDDVPNIIMRVKARHLRTVLRKHGEHVIRANALLNMPLWRFAHRGTCTAAANINILKLLYLNSSEFNFGGEMREAALIPRLSVLQHERDPILRFGHLRQFTEAEALLNPASIFSSTIEPAWSHRRTNRWHR
jgi:hypothetical protein